jgi:hypothetical protein
MFGPRFRAAAREERRTYDRSRRSLFSAAIAEVLLD